MPKGWCRPVAKTEICLRLAVGADAAEDLDLAGFALGEEQIAVGREAQQARIVEAGGVELHLEALGRDGPGVGGARNHVGAVVDGLIGTRARAGRRAVRWRRVPGDSCAASVNAAWPVSTGCWPAAVGEPERKTKRKIAEKLPIEIAGQRSR